MPQSSLETWLRKPAAVRQPPPEDGNPRLVRNTDKDEPSIATDEVTHDERQIQIGSEETITRPAPTTLKSSLHPNIQLLSPNKEDIPNLKRLTSLLLQIPYPESFYKEILTDPVSHSLTLLAFWTDPISSNSSLSESNTGKGRLIGAIRCRLLPTAPSTPRKEGPMLYISTLALLSPYRGLGIASALLGAVLRRAVREYGATSVGAHVWEANDVGLAWYRARRFREVGREAEYYRRLQPMGAVVVLRDVGVMDLTSE